MTILHAELASPELIHAARSVGRLRGWLVDIALPLWIDRGFDRQASGFHERLDFDAQPIGNVPRRLTVQARQIFVYARAIMRGWSNDSEKVGAAFDAMVARYHRADSGPGFVFSVDALGRIVNGSRDLYGHAFVLFAAAAYHQLTGDAQAIGLADETLAFIDSAMAAPNGGYFDWAPNPPASLRQNPHMHLFEALLALYEATGRRDYLERADRIFSDLKTKFFQPVSGTLPEYFDIDWTPVGGAKAIWEPGHHMEWSWLLSEYERLGGTDAGELADTLVRIAYRDGVLPGGIIADEVDGEGIVLKKSHRSWPLAEAAKAQAVRLKSGDSKAAERLAAAVDGLYDRHLSGLVPGLWFDHFDENDRLLPDYVPASTLYHIALSVFVADQVLPEGAK
jgi:mannose/cellobiose epimerase-like protein (N-acyl-D-glucosamine 2-epimerase family)